jgi:hypothetical protein
MNATETHPPCGWTVTTAQGPQVIFCSAENSSAAAAIAIATEAGFTAPPLPMAEPDAPVAG